MERFYVDLGDTLSEPCETLAEAHEVRRNNDGAGVIYRTVWSVVEE